MGRINWVERTRNLVAREGIEATFIEHEQWGKDSRLISDALKVPLPSVLKVLVCFSIAGPLLAVITGDRKLNLEKLRAIAGSDARLGRAREVEALGFEVGGVPAVGSGLRMLVDCKVLRQHYVLGSAGSPYVGVRLRPEDIARINGARVADLSAD